jgi:hypothetical protein
VIYLLDYRIYIAPLGQNVDNSNYLVLPKAVVSADVQQSTEIDFTAGISLGRTATPTASIVLAKNNSTQVTQFTYNWRFANVKIYSSIDRVTYTPIFSGFIEARTEDIATVTFRCSGYLKYLEYYKEITPLWKNHPVATKIPDPVYPVSSGWAAYVTNQDPTTLSGFYTGTLNKIFWLLGGRPYKYKAYFDLVEEVPRFWYDADSSPIIPRFTWLNQENISEDAAMLAAAGGGQLTQDTYGVVRFVNPHSFAQEFNGVTLTDSHFSQLTVAEEAATTFGKAIITFTPRYLGPNKSVFEGSIGVYLQYNEEYTHEIELQQPVDRLTNPTYYASGLSYGASGGYFGVDEYINSRDFITAVDYTGETASTNLKVPRLSSLYYPRPTYTSGVWGVESDPTRVPAQYLHVKVFNDDPARSLYLAQITLFGVAVEASEQITIRRDIPIQFSGLVQAGVIPSGFREISIAENPYIQSREQANKLLDVVSYLHKKPRPEHTLVDVVFNPNIRIGDRIQIASSAYGINGYFKVVGISTKKTGALMDITCVDISDISPRSSFYIIGSGYVSSDVRNLSW